LATEPGILAPPPAAPPPAASDLAVEYRGVSFSYPGQPGQGPRKALDRISLDVRIGERLGIFGPNGGGKSTLLKLTLGLLRPESGSIRVFGFTPDEARRRRLIGYVPQKVEAELTFPLSVRQVVEMSATLGLPPWRRTPSSARRDAERALDIVDATSLADRPIGKLSGGQLQRVMIARALAGRPRLLLLDEPTVGIDAVGQQRFADLLRSLHDRLGLTIMLVSHDFRTIAAGCDRVACLSCTLHSHVAPEGLTPQVLAEVFSHDVAAIFGDVHVDAHLARECPADPHSPHGHDHHHDHADHGHEHRRGT
jgi:zinc transport system ATP-binding protein